MCSVYSHVTRVMLLVCRGCREHCVSALSGQHGGRRHIESALNCELFDCSVTCEHVTECRCLSLSYEQAGPHTYCMQWEGVLLWACSSLDNGREAQDLLTMTYKIRSNILHHQVKCGRKGHSKHWRPQQCLRASSVHISVQQHVSAAHCWQL